MQLPIRVVRSGTRACSACGTTRNLSSGGVYFSSDGRVSAGDAIEYTIELHPSDSAPQIWLRCLGKVVRTQPAGSDENQFEVAATLERYEFVRTRE
jgi:hypothetical protein